MAHFAQIDSNNKVIQVVVVNNDVINNLEFPDSEEVGIAFCKSIYGNDTNWAQTSYNGNFRYNFASVNSTFDKDADAFIAEQPYPSWALNHSTWLWESPSPYPNDGETYFWDEATLSWIENGN